MKATLDNRIQEEFCARASLNVLRHVITEIEERIEPLKEMMMEATDQLSFSSSVIDEKCLPRLPDEVILKILAHIRSCTKNPSDLLPYMRIHPLLRLTAHLRTDCLWLNSMLASYLKRVDFDI